MPLPNLAVAAATVPPPPGSKFSSEPTGAHSTGMRNLRPSTSLGCIDIRHVAQHARPEADRIERQPIARQRRLALRGADQIVPVVAVQVLPRDLDELVQVLKAVVEIVVGVRHRRGLMLVVD